MSDSITTLKVIDDGCYDDIMRRLVEPYLEKRRKEGILLSDDNQELHYEAYEKSASLGKVVILHGFTESAEKLREMAYYLRKTGYSVFVPDLRGHGKSSHASKKKERVEIDSFDTYAEDLDLFIEKVVAKDGSGDDILIYSHSLGSTVALLYMLKHKHRIKKALLSSPMICGNMGMPVKIASTVASLLCALGGKNISAPGRCVFNGEQTWEQSDAASAPRFAYYHEKRKKEPLYQTSGPSFGWVKASVKARNTILSPESIGRLKAELLILKPEEDRQLLSEYTEKFADLSASAIKEINGSRHEIFMSESTVLQGYLNEILDFFRKE